MFLFALLVVPAASAQTEQDVEQFLKLRQHSRARAAFVEMIRDTPQEELKTITRKSPYSRYAYLREVAADRIAELSQQDIPSLLRAAFNKLSSGKPEFAEQIVEHLRSSTDSAVRAEFHAAINEGLQKIEAAKSEYPEYKHFSRANHQLLASDYKSALAEYRMFLTKVKGGVFSDHTQASIAWFRGKLKPESIPIAGDNERTTHFVVATLLAKQGKTGEAIRHVRKEIRAAQGELGQQTVPFFLKDFPTCHQLLQADSPDAIDARVEYETLLKLHQIAAAVVAYEEQNGSLPHASSNGVSWRKQIAPFFRLPNEPKGISDVFFVGGEEDTTPFVVVLGEDTIFPPDRATAPGRNMYDGKANTLFVLASHDAVPGDSSQDLSIADVPQWKQRVGDGIYGATATGDVYWFSSEYPLDQLQNLINPNDRNRVYFPVDLLLGQVLEDRRVPCDGVHCDQHSWVHMQVQLPTGQTPAEVFQEIRTAALERNWPRFYGCLTPDARYDQISTLIIDVGRLVLCQLLISG